MLLSATLFVTSVIQINFIYAHIIILEKLYYQKIYK